MATLTSPAHMTTPGVILGTAAYMSPEQSRGLDLDARTDIWAFGCVLFEMITGRLAFSGDTVSDTIVAILSREPDWSALPAATPAGVRVLLQRCLEKDVTRRLRDIGEARRELEQTSRADDGGGARSSGRGARPLYVVAGLAALGVLAVAVTLFNTRQAPAPNPSPTEYIQITNFTDSATAPSLSPDGRMVAFIRGDEAFLSSGQIYVKLLPNGEAVQLTTGSDRKYGAGFYTRRFARRVHRAR